MDTDLPPAPATLAQAAVGAGATSALRTVMSGEKFDLALGADDGIAVKPTDEGALKWTLDLKPGEKRELTVKFAIEHPNDVNVTGLE